MRVSGLHVYDYSLFDLNVRQNAIDRSTNFVGTPRTFPLVDSHQAYSLTPSEGWSFLPLGPPSPTLGLPSQS